MAEFHPDAALLAFAQAVVDSDPVLRVFASCEWDCLNDDGHVWIAAIIKEALARSGVALVPVVSMKLVDRPRRSEDPRLARANDNGGAL